MKILFAIAIILISVTSYSQSFYNTGSHVFISNGVVFSVKDSLVNKNTLTNNGNMVVGGVWLNQGTYNPGIGEITFNSPTGADDQIINHNNQSFSKITISGGGNKVILADMTIEGELVLADGVITRQNNSKIVFANSAIISGGSDQAHINAPIVQQGSGNKLFPLGNGSIYLPVELNNLNNAEVEISLNELSGTTLSKSNELERISTARYWSLQVMNGALDGTQVVLPVRNESIVSNTETVIVAEANDTNDLFRSLGQFNFVGTITDGRVTSNSAPTKSLVAIGTLADEPTLIVYNAISPNGDGQNEFLRLGNVELFPNVTVSIFNRWGDKIFEKSNYDNQNGVFKGFSNINGEKELPAGNYFYLIDKGDGSEKLNGYLSLKK